TRESIDTNTLSRRTYMLRTALMMVWCHFSSKETRFRPPTAPRNSTDRQTMSVQVLRSFVFFFSSRRRHTRSKRDWSSDVCSSDLEASLVIFAINLLLGAKLGRWLRSRTFLVASALKARGSAVAIRLGGFRKNSGLKIGRASCRERVRIAEGEGGGEEKSEGGSER